MLTKDPQPTTGITIVIKLDDHPEETGWELNQGSKEVVAYPPGTYRGDNSKEIVTRTDVYAGQEYTFTLYDKGGNGIDGGYYKIYDAPDTSDPSTVLVEGSGNFTDQVQRNFSPVGQETNEEEAGPLLQGDEKECIDCEVTDWSDWSPCSADCNGGSRSRTRTVMIPGNECGNPCPSFIEKKPCNTGPCPDECGENDCQQDEKCLNNECKPVCECNCPEMYTCNEDANCQCICPYECCKDDDCTGANQMCSSDYTCILKATDPPPCECDCPVPYTCSQDNDCECICPFECCKDGDCTGENQKCSGDYSCIPIPTDPTPCECACSSPYVCDDDNNCTCSCPYACCVDDDCGDGWECLNNACNPICDCYSPYTCNDVGECICEYQCCSNDDCDNGYECLDNVCNCPHDCCSDGDCGNGWECLNNACNPICDCYSPYTCNDVGECICEYQCCSNDDCDNGYECLNNVCNCPYDCCSGGDCGNVWEWECLNNACNPSCDCDSPYICNDVGECTDSPSK